MAVLVSNRTFTSLIYAVPFRYLAQDTYLSSVVSWANKEGVKVHQFGLSVNKEPFAESEL